MCVILEVEDCIGVRCYYDNLYYKHTYKQLIQIYEHSTVMSHSRQRPEATICDAKPRTLQYFMIR